MCFFLGLKYKSTLVRGYLTDIDRENKSIVVSDEIAIEYDVLLIASPNQGILDIF
jgi:NADH dehydrogenase FAD-containing subunit